MTPKSDDTLKILVVDDEVGLLRSCEKILTAEGYQVLSAARGEEALQLARRHRPPIVLSDIVLPDTDGMEVLRQVKELDPHALVIMITSFATVNASIEAIEAGAYDYIPKPFSATQLKILVGRAANQVRLERDNRRLRERLLGADSWGGLVGRSEPMRRLRELVRKVAPTDASVFISGESGTGKELFARAIHGESDRSGREMIAVNCAAMPESLLESELFGHERGAFTGADHARRGLLHAADGGTFFLDEVCEMGLDLQAKLLRVIQERRVRRVGGEEELPVDVRVIAATNHDPARAVRDGLLREDLYFRLNVVPLLVPPLRERREDVPLLCAHFLALFNERYDRSLELAPEALNSLIDYDWPGNVRELQNAIERAVSLGAPRGVIEPADLPHSVVQTGSGGDDAADLADRPYHEAKEEALERFERAYLRMLIDRCGGNVSEAARRAGMARKTVHRMLSKHGMSAEELLREEADAPEP